VLTYHSVAFGPPPLHVDPTLFERHASTLTACGAVPLTVGEVASALRAGSLPERSVAVTFDDGYASVLEHALPALSARGIRATVFPVAGHLGRTSAWPTQPPAAPRLPLLDAAGLRRLADEGWEIGGHGIEHRPLRGLRGDDVAIELARCRSALSEATGVEVRSFAFPYGSVPAGSAAALAAAGYTAACGTRASHVVPGSDPLLLPRVDAHYLRDPARLARAAAGGAGAYLGVRRVASRVRRLVRADHARGDEP
jgi:peptidoglycan/xylan/chitin deacetylase (PgdA/CDA1 family)